MPDLRDINAIVAGYVLVPNPSSNCKAQSLAPLDQFHLDEIAVRPISLPLPLDSQMDAVPSFLEGFNGRAVRNVDHADIVHVGDDVVHLQPTIDGSSTAINDLSYVYGGVVGDVRVVSSSCDRKAKTGIASLKRDVIIFPWLLIKDAVAFWIVGMIKTPGLQQQTQSVALVSLAVEQTIQLWPLGQPLALSLWSEQPLQLQNHGYNFELKVAIFKIRH